MQILHPFAGSVQQYTEQLANPDCYRPSHCPQCQTKHPLTAHGFYTRTLIDTAFDGIIRVRRYLCQACQRTVSLLPEFVLPYLRSGLAMIALFLIARLLHEKTLHCASPTAPSSMPYQRGQFWIRRRHLRPPLEAVVPRLRVVWAAQMVLHRTPCWMSGGGAMRFVAPRISIIMWGARFA